MMYMLHSDDIPDFGCIYADGFGLSMKVLMPQIVNLMAEHHVKKIYQVVQIQMQTT